MRVVNKNAHPVHVKLRSEANKIDYIHLMPKAAADVPAGYVVDQNWLVGAQNVNVTNKA